MGELLRFEADSPEQMAEFGARLARQLPDSTSGPLLLYLSGELGAGKTTLTRGLLRALGVSGPVRSPSYTLVETHVTDRLDVLHVDLYRLADPDELEPLGLRDSHVAGALWVVEWPERAAGALPAPTLWLDLAIDEATQGRVHGVQRREATPAGSEWFAQAMR